MANLPSEYEKSVLERLRNGDKKSFTILFNHYYKDLVTFAFGFLHNLAVAEEIVQEVFIKLWENRYLLEIDRSLKSYLLKSVQNRCLNWINHLKIRSEFNNHILRYPVLSENETENYLLHSDLEARLQIGLEKMPVEAAQAFRMNRFENLSYPEIAEKLGVSIRTIENRISKALSFLRDELKEFLILIALLFRMF
ncbi:MAG TPA: RNA polymerase sigma-70 factor [Bacteroidales bacterium]|nr:RNA polymerase sigma-70 factor [Bacteroidales bacterium]